MYIDGDEREGLGTIYTKSVTWIPGNGLFLADVVVVVVVLQEHFYMTDSGEGQHIE